MHDRNPVSNLRENLHHSGDFLVERGLWYADLRNPVPSVTVNCGLLAHWARMVIDTWPTERRDTGDSVILSLNVLRCFKDALIA